MGAAIKIVLGIILLLIGLWLLLPIESWIGFPQSYYSGVALEQFITVFIGLIAPFLVFVGGLLIWIESEELRYKKPVAQIPATKKKMVTVTKKKRR